MEKENQVEELVRLGIALANDLVDEHGETWIHLAEKQFEDIDHGLLIGTLAMFLKTGFEEDEVVVILKIAISTAFSMVYGDSSYIQQWKDPIH